MLVGQEPKLGREQVPGVVAAPDEAGPFTVLSPSQEQRVLMVCAGPFWL
jgi:hypothetical protein